MQNLYFDATIEVEEPEPPKNIRLEKYAVILAVLLTVISLLFLLPRYYLDISSLCAVRIYPHFLNGNRDTILAALKLIKKDYPTEYINICKNIKSINEAYCLKANGTDQKLELIKSTGCYIKNSGIIYLQPNSNIDSNTINTRAQTIVKYSKMGDIKN